MFEKKKIFLIRKKKEKMNVNDDAKYQLVMLIDKYLKEEPISSSSKMERLIRVANKVSKKSSALEDDTEIVSEPESQDIEYASVVEGARRKTDILPNKGDIKLQSKRHSLPLPDIMSLIADDVDNLSLKVRLIEIIDQYIKEARQQQSELHLSFETLRGIATRIKCMGLAKKDCKEPCVWFEKEKTCRDTFPPVNWPARTLDYDTFSKNMYEAVNKRIYLEDDESRRYCQNDPYLDEKMYEVSSSRPAPQQQLCKLMIDPSSPYNGLLVDHYVGTGKTRLGLSILGNFRRKPTRLIWVTTIRAKVSLRATQKSDFPSFAGLNEDPFINGSSAKTHKSGQIALFTYIEFVNSLNSVFGTGGGKETNAYGRIVLHKRKEEFGDPLHDTVVIIDEAHKIFEDKNGAGKNQYLIERAAYESYEHAKKSGTTSCRWILLTATPMPTIEVPTDARQRPETAGGPQAAFRLLNMLITDYDKRLPIDHSRLSSVMPKAFFNQIPDNFESLTGEQYIEKAKGLVSFFEPVWPHIFAGVHGESEQIIVKLDQDKQVKKITSKLDSTCAPAIKKKSAVGIAQCYLRRLHWYGDFLSPRSSGKRKGATSKLPGNLIEKCAGNYCVGGNDGKLNELNIPRARTLYETILQADEDDMKKFGKKFKHVIYSSMKSYTADMYASSLVLASRNTSDPIMYENPNERYHELGLQLKVEEVREIIKEAGKKKTIVEKKTVLEGELQPKNQQSSSNVLFFMHDDLTPKETDAMIVGFNDHKRNNYGQIARILVLGPGRKEALSLHDVKYVHIMEPQITSTDTTQIVGRARRYCSHTGIPIDARSIRVYIYGLVLPQRLLKLREQSIEGQELSEGEISHIAQGIIKTSDEKLKTDLMARQKILSWIRDGAVDEPIVNKKNIEEVKDAIKDVHMRLKITDEAAQQTAQTQFRRYSAIPKRQITIPMLREECNKKGVQLPKATKKDELLRCCGPDVLQVPPDCIKEIKRGRKPSQRPQQQQEVPSIPQQQQQKFTNKQLMQMCEDKHIPLKSTIKQKAKLEQCCGPNATVASAIQDDCITKQQIKKLQQQPQQMIEAAPSIQQPPQIVEASQQQLTQQIIEAEAPSIQQPKKKKIVLKKPPSNMTETQKQRYEKACKNKEQNAQQLRTIKAKNKFLQICKDLGY